MKLTTPLSVLALTSFAHAFVIPTETYNAEIPFSNTDTDTPKISSPSAASAQTPLHRRASAGLPWPIPSIANLTRPLKRVLHPSKNNTLLTTLIPDFPVKARDVGCKSSPADRLSSIKDYTLARQYLGRHCDSGALVPPYGVSWVRKGDSYAYICNYNKKPLKCTSWAMENAELVLQYNCPAESLKAASEAAGWVHVQKWGVTYGRARHGENICSNLPYGKYQAAAAGEKGGQEGDTTRLAMDAGDFKKIGGYLTPVEKHAWRAFQTEGAGEGKPFPILRIPVDKWPSRTIEVESGPGSVVNADEEEVDEEMEVPTRHGLTVTVPLSDGEALVEALEAVGNFREEFEQRFPGRALIG